MRGGSGRILRLGSNPSWHPFASLAASAPASLRSPMDIFSDTGVTKLLAELHQGC